MPLGIDRVDDVTIQLTADQIRIVAKTLAERYAQCGAGARSIETVIMGTKRSYRCDGTIYEETKLFDPTIIDNPTPELVIVPAPVVIRELTLTCGACPTQYEGTTVDGRGVYIRYRHGVLDVHIGTDVDDAIGNDPVLRWKHPDDSMGLDGVMTEDQLRERVPSWIVLPDTF